MNKAILICLCNAVLLTALCLTAQARSVAGLIPAVPLSEIVLTALDQSDQPFAKPAMTSTRDRLFDEAATITKGLRRFKEQEAVASEIESRRYQAEVPGAAERAMTNGIPEINAQLNTQAQPADMTQPRPEPNKRLVLFAVLILLIAILAKACVFVMRRQKKRKSTFGPDEAQTTVTDLEREEETVSTAEPSTSSTAEPFVETGNLGPGMVPALLKRCADMPRPVVLKVTKGSCEKLIYFTGGRVSGALTQTATTSEPEVRWRKLSDLLIRENLVTMEGCAQGVALIKTQPDLRFGEALLKLGLIDLADVRHALTRQAKVTIYSLILFPEGRYQIFFGDGALPPEETVSIEITSLIREASRHQAEWTAIRQALPSLDKVLRLTPNGRSKLEKASISSQQEATLSLIDGIHTINDLCIASVMMDYEVYRFLYLMVKAGVLK